MKALLADLLEKMAEADVSSRACMVQLNVVSMVFQVMYAHLDEQSKSRIREDIYATFEKISSENETTNTEIQLLRMAIDRLLSRKLIFPVSLGK
ncbi:MULTISPECIES: sigma-S stabilization anti-adapter protein IraP [Enterobacteriaceae]|uniref:sigma-S stabilization anti-adapter protein IraP n=1 Tax=Enterobacteriaceae TaxID=543 RepID=UPI0006690D9B|nr:MULTISPECIES: sigma-S stabilization anti-adapter protein IraP [Enterobacteriaceae]